MVRKYVNWAAVVVSLVLLIASVAWLYKEAQWAQWSPSGDDVQAQQLAAFTYGSIGLEVLPLKYAAVIGTVSRSAYIMGTEDDRSIWDTYGFLPNPAANDDADPLCAVNAEQKLPYGFNVTNYLPKIAQKTPLEFVGLSCAACHSGTLHTEAGTTTEIINGMGNPALDVIAFTDVVRSAVLDPTLTTTKIIEAYRTNCKDIDGLGFVPRTFDETVDRVMIWAWLRAARNQISEDTAKEGLPYHGAQLKDAKFMPAGPSRTRPFRSIIRVALELPGEENFAYSKIPAVFEQRVDLRPRSQYDGSIADPVTRSFVAAYASGTSLVSLSKPEMEFNIRSAAGYTEELGISVPVDKFVDLFPNEAPTSDQVKDGLEVYKLHCAACHGYRPIEGDRLWAAKGEKLHQVSLLKPVDRTTPIGTDPERIMFRYSNLLVQGLTTILPGWDEDLEKQRESLKQAKLEATAQGQLAEADLWVGHLERLNLSARQFRLGHPLYFPETDVSDEVGYINNPIPYAYLRAPYLHNGSVPTLRQLINLDERPQSFCRGDNDYDPAAVGLIAPPPDSNGVCPPGLPFLFDTGARGNSNQGHNYPWAYQGADWNEKDLTDLLAYLKTL